MVEFSNKVLPKHKPSKIPDAKRYNKIVHKVLSNYIHMVAEYEAYIQSIDDMEQRVINDNVYPKVRSNRCKAFCYVVSELTKNV